MWRKDINKKQAFKVKIHFAALILSCLVIIFGSNYLAAQALLTTIPLGPPLGNGVGQIGVGVNPTTNHIYVAGNVIGSSVSPLLLIDGVINKIIGNVSAGVEGEASGIAVNPKTNRIYVISQES